ncbi:hypothetical protein SAMN05444581_11827 [Methylocapsa palsarum]|uniref:Uncharacterized protein n=1 Tax=Methylocapsa palsarum TaxID=1612308 RepID=A0A1I4C4A6_9HYPH|nr:hypothetical protein SAMN05444581_11827 [Methylocapsa palsarum]
MKKVYLAYLLLFVIVAMLLVAALMPAGAGSM